MTRVMKENLKSEKINALSEAKQMLGNVKEYYDQKVALKHPIKLQFLPHNL